MPCGRMHETAAYPWPWVSYPPPWVTGQDFGGIKVGTPPTAAGSAPMPPGGLPDGWIVGWDLDQLQWAYAGPGNQFFFLPMNAKPSAADWAFNLGTVPTAGPTMTLQPQLFGSWLWPVMIATGAGLIYLWYTKTRRR
jgi:hypothetical protein